MLSTHLHVIYFRVLFTWTIQIFLWKITIIPQYIILEQTCSSTQRNEFSTPLVVTHSSHSLLGHSNGLYINTFISMPFTPKILHAGSFKNLQQQKNCSVAIFPIARAVSMQSTPTKQHIAFTRFFNVWYISQHTLFFNIQHNISQHIYVNHNISVSIYISGHNISRERGVGRLIFRLMLSLPTLTALHVSHQLLQWQ